MKYIKICAALITLIFTISAFAGQNTQSRQKQLIAHLIEQQIEINHSISKSVYKILRRYPEQVVLVLDVAFEEYPEDYEQIIQGAIRAEPALSNDVIDMAFKHQVAQCEDIIEIAVLAEPAYADDVVSSAIKSDPENLDEIVRVALRTEPLMADSIMTQTATEQPDEFTRIMELVFETLPDEIVKYVDIAITNFPEFSSEILATALNSDTENRDAELIDTAIAAGMDEQEAAATAKKSAEQ